MQALLAAGLMNLGSSIIDKVFPSSTSSTATSTGSTDFGSVLKSELQNTVGATVPAQEVEGLSKQIGELGDQLAMLPEVRNFVGAGNDFTVKPDGNGFVVVREDGTQLRLQRDGLAEDAARALHTSSYAKAQLESGTLSAPAVADCAWLVTQSEAA